MTMTPAATEPPPPPPPEAAGPAERAPRVEVVLSARTVVIALGVLLGIVLIVVVQEALLSIALALVLVLGLDPPVTALERRGWGRGKAALFVFAVIGLVLFVIVVWAAKPVWNDVRDFVQKLPSYIDEAQHNAPLSDIDKSTDAFKKLESVAQDAASKIPSAATHMLGAAAGAVGAVFSLVTLAFLTLFGIINKPGLTRAALALMPPDVAERVDRTVDEVSHTISFALLGNIVISVIAGTVVGVAAWLVDAPSPIVLALIVGLLDLIPQVGSTIAAFIVCIITLIASGLGPALVLLAVILVYQQAENYVIQPAVMRQAVELSGFATIAVVILGSALLGIVGAVLAVPVAASVKVVVNELTRGRRARMDALRETAAQTPA
jgi:predicted PurR-regulated permease PerM